jgi:ATP-dependent protease ClpP protease subunit
MRRSGPINTIAAPPAPADRRPSNLVAAADPSQRRSWFKVGNAVGIAPNGQPRNAARIDIYEEIGGWGVTAAEFAEQLRSVDASEIDLHINSPGGSVFDGLTIFNALVGHPAAITVYVDGLAASAASFIAQAGDTVVMNRGSMMMLHDAIAMTWGNAFDHDESAGLLRKVGASIAAVYASRAGGTAETWAAVMAEKNGQGRWYTADEAVEAGLADRVAGAADAAEQQGAEPVESPDDPMETFDKSSIAAGHRLVMHQRDEALVALERMPTLRELNSTFSPAPAGGATADTMAWLTGVVERQPYTADPPPLAWLGNGQ